MNESQGGYTQIPNVLLDEYMQKLSGTELKVCLAIARQTFGWHRQGDKLSIAQLCDMTGASNRAVCTATENLLKKGIVRRQGDGQGFVYSLSVSTCEESSQVGDKSCEESSQVEDATCEESSQVGDKSCEESSQVEDATCEESSQEPVKKVHTQNKYIKKENTVVADATSRTDFSSDVKAKEKHLGKTRKPAKKVAHPVVEEPPKPPSEHQLMFEKICQIVGWDWKTIGEKEKGQVAQTLGILKRADYTLDELNRFGREVWVKDWRWEKYKQYPTLSLLRSEIGKLRTSEQQKDELRTPTDGVSWKKIFEEQKTKFAEYEWSTVT